jgi:hypothetical protein
MERDQVPKPFDACNGFTGGLLSRLTEVRRDAASGDDSLKSRQGCDIPSPEDAARCGPRGASE